MGRQSNGRAPINRSSGKNIVIYVEGKSELKYFRHLQQVLRLYHVQFKCFGGFDANIVKTVEQELQKQPELNGQEVAVFIVFDLDVCKESQYNKICESAKKRNYHVYTSRPSFEIWLLAHHELVTPSPMSNKEIQRKLAVHWNSEFSKTHPKITEISEDYEVAIENVKGIKELDFARNLNYTDLDDLIKELKLLKNSS